MGKMKTRNNPFVIEKLNEVQAIRRKLQMQSIDNVEIMSKLVEKKYGKTVKYTDIDAVRMANLLSQYRLQLQNQLTLQECAGGKK